MQLLFSIFYNKRIILLIHFVVTPLDVVKIRLQAQQKAMLSNKCFLYCNGLMDHLCPCLNGKGPVWAKGNGKFTGTMVCLCLIFDIISFIYANIITFKDKRVKERYNSFKRGL